MFSGVFFTHRVDANIYSNLYTEDLNVATDLWSSASSFWRRKSFICRNSFECCQIKKKQGVKLPRQTFPLKPEALMKDEWELQQKQTQQLLLLYRGDKSSAALRSALFGVCVGGSSPPHRDWKQTIKFTPACRDRCVFVLCANKLFMHEWLIIRLCAHKLRRKTPNCRRTLLEARCAHICNSHKMTAVNPAF